ncbi:MAG: 4-(cytidine 5'-diphospho)-2-C-methyl-D-erythritol kinase [Bacteroidales bacterium]|nr:4-(cytidine 5'-diphospho)-2-C-methyl-D-erythritol kinase [Bacteroidales bacterium]
MICFPNAKVNIGLKVLRRRADGYHDIESLLYPIGWCDILEVVPCEGEGPFLELTGTPIPGTPGENMVMKAFSLVRKHHPLPSCGIHLHKVIPAGSGLGGGSADGVFMLHLLNRQFGLSIGIDEMTSMAGKLGSDCPFFLRNRPALVTGKGDRIEVVETDLSSYTWVIVVPEIRISTREAYTWITPATPPGSLASRISRPVEEWRGQVFNDFEDPVFQRFPHLPVIRDTLYNRGAVYASLTGSGSAIFGLFRELPCDIAGSFPGCTVWADHSGKGVRPMGD